jgi:hypothetical protein
MTNLTDKLQNKLYDACKNGNLNIVKHLLDNPNMKQHIDLTHEKGYALVLACSRRNKDMIDYLLQQKEYKDTQLAVDAISYEVGTACVHSFLDVIHFFHDKEDYRKYIDLDHYHGWFFRTAYTHNNEEVLKFLILEAKIDNGEYVQNTYRNEKGLYKDFCQNLFKERDSTLEVIPKIKM